MTIMFLVPELAAAAFAANWQVSTSFHGAGRFGPPRATVVIRLRLRRTSPLSVQAVSIASFLLFAIRLFGRLNFFVTNNVRQPLGISSIMPY